MESPIFPFHREQPVKLAENRLKLKEGPINFVNFIENMRGDWGDIENYREGIAMAKAICWAANYGKWKGWRTVDLEEQ